MGVEVDSCHQAFGPHGRPVSDPDHQNGIGLCMRNRGGAGRFGRCQARRNGGFGGVGVLMACAQTCFLQAMRFADATLTLPK